MATLPSVATLSSTATITWPAGTVFQGFLLLGLVVPVLGTPWAELALGGQYPGERIPIFTKVSVVNGKFDTTVGVIYNTSLSPVNSQYACWYYDNSNPPRQIAGPSALFSVTAPTLTPPSFTFTVPSPGTTAPTPDA